MNPNQFFNWEEYNQTREHPRHKYSLFGKVGRSWKRVSPITCRNKKESELFFHKTLARSDAFGIQVEVRPV